MFRIVAISKNKNFLDNSVKFLTQFNKEFTVATLNDPSMINDYVKTSPADIYLCDHDPPEINALSVYNKRLAVSDYRPFILAAKDLGRETIITAYESGINLCVAMDDSPAVNYMKIANKVIFLIEKYRAEENNKLNDRRLSALVKLSGMHDEDFTSYMNFALEESINLTNSNNGYLALYDKETQELDMKIWSKKSMDQCMVKNYPMKYYLPKSGLWGEPIRRRAPIVVNDYNLSSVPKKGVPEGHIKLNKLMMIPLMYNNEVIGTAGVGNKINDYNESDLNQFIMMMDGFTHIYMERKQSEESMETHRRLSNVLMNSPTAMMELDNDMNIIDCSDTMRDILDLKQPFINGKLPDTNWVTDKILELIEKLKYTGNTKYSDTVIGDSYANGTKYRVRIYTDDSEKNKLYLVSMEDYTNIAKMSGTIENSLLVRKTFNDLIVATLMSNIRELRGKIKYLTDGGMRESLHYNLKQIELKTRALKEYGDIGILDPEWMRVKDAFMKSASSIPKNINMQINVDGLLILADYTFDRAFTHLIEESIKSKKLTKIKLSYKVTKGRLLIIYEDDGDGVPYERKSVLFTEDIRSESIGFFVVNAIINTSNFEIMECGDPSKGARYEISVPADRFEIF